MLETIVQHLMEFQRKAKKKRKIYYTFHVLVNVTVSESEIDNQNRRIGKTSLCWQAFSSKISDLINFIIYGPVYPG